MRKRLVGLVAVLSVALAGAWAPSARADDSSALDAVAASDHVWAAPATLDRSSWG